MSRLLCSLFFLKFYFSFTTLLSKLCMGNKRKKKFWATVISFSGFCCGSSSFLLHTHAQPPSLTCVVGPSFLSPFESSSLLRRLRKITAFHSYVSSALRLMLYEEARLNESSNFFSMTGHVHGRKAWCAPPMQTFRPLQSIAKCLKRLLQMIRLMWGTSARRPPERPVYKSTKFCSSLWILVCFSEFLRYFRGLVLIWVKANLLSLLRCEKQQTELVLSYQFSPLI